jgi:hypothetical protein
MQPNVNDRREHAKPEQVVSKHSRAKRVRRLRQGEPTVNAYNCDDIIRLPHDEKKRTNA